MRTILWLSKDEVLKTGVCNIANAASIVERAFCLFDAQEAIIAQESALRLHASGQDQACYALPAYVGGGMNVCGLKWSAHGAAAPLGATESRIQATAIINERDSGFPLAMMNATEIGAARTGAVTALALQRLAPRDVKKIALCGAGGQAERQLQAILHALPFAEQVSIWSRGGEKAQQLIHAYQGQTPLILHAAKTVEEAVDKAEVIVAATSAPSPYLTPAHIQDASLYVHIGFNEITPEAIGQFSHIVVDTWEEAKHVSGQSLFRMFRQGLLEETRITGKLGSILTEKLSVPRGTKNAKVMFDAFGLPIFDISLAWEAYQYACRVGLGTQINW